jgi:hypothetical protein
MNPYLTDCIVNTPHPMEKKEKEIKTYKTLPNIQVG